MTNSKPIRFTLRLPPSINHYYITTKARKRVMSAHARAWMTEAQWIVKQAVMEAGWRSTHDRKVIMRVWVYWPDERRRDTGNLNKALCDAPEGIVYDDDRWVLTREMDFAVDRNRPRVEIEIEEAAQAAKEA